MASRRSRNGQKDLIAPMRLRRKRSLFLPRFVDEAAAKISQDNAGFQNAYRILRKWADLEEQGRLDRKETSTDADFLNDVFGDALGYRRFTEESASWDLERSFTVPDCGVADGAIGQFGGQRGRVAAVIELKGADTDLDLDRFNGRTAVGQCWDYLNALPETPWGIVSNFSRIRLYHRRKTPNAYEEFPLQELVNPQQFRRFYTLFSVAGLLKRPYEKVPLCVELLDRTENQQRQVGDELYTTYSDNRHRLIEHLVHQHGKSLERGIHIAQKLLDRIIFIAFCEDRGLLPRNTIESACETVHIFHRATNPRWQNFLELFHAVDKGHPNMYLETGYNGGLFRREDEVDDLQLTDDWTTFFNNLGKYDFRDEVNVDVLGHLFERSVTELEKIRQGGLFALEQVKDGETVVARMPKSAQRKRFGVYYTPPEFTRFIVDETVSRIVDERLGAMQAQRNIADADLRADKPHKNVIEFWQDCVRQLRSIRVCDPACGSGAFLMRAYDVFEEQYTKYCELLSLHDGVDIETWIDQIPDWIVTENLYGVDLSPQSVEITQLALWIRSARREKNLADLSKNILCGNSLVDNAEVDPDAFDWREQFPAVFDGGHGGFDCVIGNPPWERMKLQEREFFSLSAPQIAAAVNAAQRRRMIAELAAANPELHSRYVAAAGRAEAALAEVRSSGRFPLTARGDINTYMLFAELAKTIVAPNGLVGLLVPSGIATDHTTREFFDSLVETQRLEKLHDFENRKKVFPDVDGRFKFSILVFGGEARKSQTVDFTFFNHRMEDLAEKDRHIPLTKRDFAVLNPNTKTCPVFRSRRDADLTKAVYRRVPILIDDNRKDGGNPWGVRFVRMFDQTNDAELFTEANELQKQSFKLDGNVWRKGNQEFLPLYEAKMVQSYDHRAASVIVQKGNWVRQGQTEPTTLVDHQNPEFAAMPRWWMDAAKVDGALPDRDDPAWLCFKDVTSATNQRTMIASMIPRCGVLNSAPLMLTGTEPRLTLCLLANLNSLAMDYVARQKVGSLHLNFFIVKQLPIFPPEQYDDRCPWLKRGSLKKWISDRVLKLTCTANDMIPLANAAGFDPPVHRWNPQERAELLAELDAAFFVLYGFKRADVEYVLSTFQGLSKPDDSLPGLFDAPNEILEQYDRLTS